MIMIDPLDLRLTCAEVTAAFNVQLDEWPLDLLLTLLSCCVETVTITSSFSMNCSVSPAVTRSRKALRAKGSQGFVRCLKVLQPVEKPVENSCMPPLRSNLFSTRPPFFFSMHIRIPTGVVRTVRKIFSLFWVYRGHFYEKSYTINKKCRRCKEFAQVFRQNSRGFYPGFT